MKISSKVGLIIIGIVLVAALAVLFTMYSRQAAERSQLHERLDRAQTLLPGLINQRQNLEDELVHAESLLAESKAKFPESVESIEYDDDLFEIADDCNVGLSRVTASPPSSKIVGAVTYSVSPFVLGVQGSINDILDFIFAIRTGDDFQLPWSAEVTSVSITLGVSASTANINVNIYGYKG
jgi:hypothetical protein